MQNINSSSNLVRLTRRQNEIRVKHRCCFCTGGVDWCLFEAHTSAGSVFADHVLFSESCLKRYGWVL